MARFLIEVPHSSDEVECLRVIQIFLRTGSHFLANVDWGCMDGVHKAWAIVEVENKDEARSVLPPAFRPQANIISLNKFTMNDVEVHLSQQQV